MADSEKLVKQKIVAQYDQEALEKDNMDWLQKGGNERVPESQSAHYFIDRKVNEALSMCGGVFSSESKVLEIGCSFGHMTALLARKCKDLTAVDISPASIRIAEKRLQFYGIQNTKFVVDDAEYLSNLPDNTFDVVFSFSTIRFCPRPEEAMKAMYRKLKPGGIAIVDFPNRYSPWHLIVKKAISIDKHIFDHLYSAPEVVRLFEGAGFEVQRVKRFLFTTKRLPSGLLPFSKAAEFILERIPFASTFAGIIMVKGIKK